MIPSKKFETDFRRSQEKYFWKNSYPGLGFNVGISADSGGL